MSDIKIFQSEINDGLADQIRSSASIAYCSTVDLKTTTCDKALNFIHNESIRNKIIAEQRNIDLFYLESVLVSVGWNKNDDVFLPEQTWEARHTPEDKQFNFMHDENDIIGHIVGCYVLTKDGKAVSEDQPRPDEFDIITQAVLYNSWTEEENRKRMEKILSEIEENKWFVSMECLFAGFDYALINEKGTAKLLERNESSAFLTKHLRTYGGTGEYQGYKVGRALKNICFSGKGLVSSPANPRSIIFKSKSVASFNVDENSINYDIGELNMSDSNLLEKQLKDVQSELASAKAENQEIKAKIEEAKNKEFASKVEAFEEQLEEKTSTIAEMEETIKSSQVRIAELEDAIAQSKEQLATAEKWMDEMKKKEKKDKRKASLLEAGFDQEEAEETLASFDNLEDEAFDGIVAMMKKKMAKKGAESEAGVVPAEETETEAEAEVNAETFEEVETSEATLVVQEEEDSTTKTRASISEWLEKNVLTK